MADQKDPGDAETLHGDRPSIASAEPRQEPSLGPYRLLEHIGGGGMGRVYRAEDTRLGRIVALKLLPPDLTRDPLAKARFLQEARSASALDHPNICSIYDVGETSDFQLYLVMPFYGGETLRQRIDRGPLPIAEALGIAAQVAQGLAQTHQRGIVHRDLKPSNLIVTADGLVKILDFGVAKLVGGDGLTRTGTIIGTPSYMSPEQMRGDDEDERTDLWALGVVLYEMLAGRKPFRGGEASVLRDAILRRKPESLRKRRPEVPAELERLVAGLLAKHPGARPAPAEAVARTLRALAGGEPTSLTLLRSTGTEKRKMRLLFAGLALILALVLAGAFHLLRRDGPAPPQSSEAARAEHRLSVVVLGFRDLTGEDSTRGWLGPALTEMLTTELAAGAQVRVVPTEQAVLARSSLRQPPGEGLNGVTLSRLRSLAGADLAVVGSYLALEGPGDPKLRLDIRILSLPEGDVVASTVEVGPQSELFGLVSRSGETLRRDLGISNPTEEQAREARRLLPAGSAAIRFYTEALVRLRSYEPEMARDLLLQAARLDPASPAVHSALAEAFTLLGHDADAREAALQAFKLRQTLPQEQQLLIEARLYKAEKQWVRASEVYRSLWTFFPDEMDYGLQLAFTLMMEGRGTEALAILADLRRRPAPEGEDPRIDLIVAQTAWRLSKLALQESAAARCITKARRMGATRMLAHALVLRGAALEKTGHLREAVTLLRQAESLAVQEGDRWTTGMALSNLGSTLQELGQWREAEEVQRRSLAMAHEIGTSKGIGAQLFALGELHRDQGDLAQARQMFEESLRLYTQTGDPMWQGLVQDAIASISLSAGDPEDAERLLTNALDVSHLVRNRRNEVQALQGLAILRNLQGDLKQARQLQEKALQSLRGLGRPALAASALSLSADLLHRTGDRELAQRRLDQAVAAGRKVGNVLVSGRLLELRARFACRTADLATCRSAGQAALDVARKLGARPLETEALRTLAQAARASGQRNQARNYLEDSLRLSLEMGDELSATTSRLELARIELEAGEVVSAERLARETAEWYRTRRFPGGEAAATALLADSLFRLGRNAEAWAATERARTLLPEGDLELRRSIDSSLARIVAPARL